ncbi:MAG: hypothetical protein ACRD0B_08425 [Acidimicrobiales bacterium]
MLGTRAAGETVDRALREVHRLAALRRAAALVRSGGPEIVELAALAELRG